MLYVATFLFILWVSSLLFGDISLTIDVDFLDVVTYVSQLAGVGSRVVWSTDDSRVDVEASGRSEGNHSEGESPVVVVTTFNCNDLLN